MRIRIAVLTLVLAVMLAGALPVVAAMNTNAALDYLKTQQNADGGFGSGFSPGSAVNSTADAVLAIVAAGGNPATFAKGVNTPVTYLAENASSATTAGDLSKFVLALVAAGENPRQFGGVDSVARLESLIGFDGKIGGANDTFVSQLVGVLALKSVERPIPTAAVDLIKKAQQAGGGWAWDGTAGTAADTNTTAFAVQSLMAAGEAACSPAVTNALAYYKGIQNADGGWPYQNPSDYGTTTDANSTAAAIQAMLAAGLDPSGADWTTTAGNSPVAALEALQNKSGAFAWKADTPDDNLLATVQALPALAGKAFPLATMAVGEVTAPAPATMPTTGGELVDPAWVLTLSGLAVAFGGYALRRRR